LIYFPYCSTTVTGSKLPYHGGAGTGAAAKGRSQRNADDGKIAAESALPRYAFTAGIFGANLGQQESDPKNHHKHYTAVQHVIPGHSIDS
jgi:hypothetical protein